MVGRASVPAILSFPSLTRERPLIIKLNLAKIFVPECDLRMKRRRRMDRFEANKLAEKILYWVFSILVILFLGWALSNWNRQDWVFVIALIVVAFLALLALIKTFNWRDKIYKDGYEQGYKDGKSNRK
jgi:hypothetical protein